MTPGEGRFSEQVMTRAMRQVADRIGADSSDAQLLRLTNNAVYALPTAGLVIRIARTLTLHDRVSKTVALGRWFAEIGASIIQLAGPEDQPIEVDGLLATVWAYLPDSGVRPDAADLGNALRTFHALPRPPFPLPMWDPVGDARRRIADAEALPAAERQALVDWCDQLGPQLTDLVARTTRSLVHGDAHVSNLLRDPHGHIVMCDLDAACIGPWQADLVAVPVGEARFGYTGAHQRLAAAYGYDVLTDPDWALFRAARELKMIAAATPLLASSPGIATEFNLRLRSVLDQDSGVRWTPFAAINGQSPR